MKRKLIILGIALFSQFAFSQDYLQNLPIEKITKTTNGKIQNISFKNNSGISTSQSQVILKQILGNPNGLVLNLKKTSTDAFGVQHETYDFKIEDVKVLYKTIKVHSKDGYLKSINGDLQEENLVSSKNGLKSLDAIIKLAAQKYSYFNFKNFKASTDEESIQGKLVILPAYLSYNKKTSYAYSLLLNSKKDKEEGLTKVFFDANTGEILYQESLIKKHKSISMNDQKKEYLLSRKLELDKKLNVLEEGTVETQYSGVREAVTNQKDSLFVLENERVFTKNFLGNRYLDMVEGLDSLLAAGNYDSLEVEKVFSKYSQDFTNNSSVWTKDSFTKERDEYSLDVFWGVSETEKYFLDVFDRNSIDNEGVIIRSYYPVKFTEMGIFNHGQNAAWLGLKEYFPTYTGTMIYGDGTGIPFLLPDINPITTLDVSAHELGHAIMSSEANLIYQRESGALNEGFSDIWGASLDYFSDDPKKDPWLIGEELYADSENPQAFRSMKDPKVFDQPDTYKGQLWVDASDACQPSSSNDQCGVHTNSGVLNYWFYLLSEGGSGTNDNGLTYNVEPIGIDKASKIAYSLITDYLTEVSDYNETKDLSIEFVNSAFGDDSTEIESVVSAWCAVGVALDDECQELSIKENLKDSFAIYPNPVKDVLNITSKNVLKNSKYSIVNAAGVNVQKGMISNNRIDVNNLTVGVYVLSFELDGKTVTQKFIKK